MSRTPNTLTTGNTKAGGRQLHGIRSLLALVFIFGVFTGFAMMAGGALSGSRWFVRTGNAVLVASLFAVGLIAWPMLLVGLILIGQAIIVLYLYPLLSVQGILSLVGGLAGFGILIWATQHMGEQAPPEDSAQQKE